MRRRGARDDPVGVEDHRSDGVAGGHGDVVRIRSAPSIEDSLHYGTGTASDSAVVVAQLDGGGVERSGEPHERFRLGRQRVGGPAVDEVPTVPYPLAESI